MSAHTICSYPRCPEPAVRHGRCRAHDVRQADAHYKRLTRAVRARARDRCEQCGAAAPKGTGAVDHVVPLAEGGRDDESNTWLLCDRCDGLKTSSDLRRIAALRRRGGVAPVTREHVLRRGAFREENRRNHDPKGGAQKSP